MKVAFALTLALTLLVLGDAALLIKRERQHLLVTAPAKCAGGTGCKKACTFQAAHSNGNFSASCTANAPADAAACAAATPGDADVCGAVETGTGCSCARVASSAMTALDTDALCIVVMTDPIAEVVAVNSTAACTYTAGTTSACTYRDANATVAAGCEAAAVVGVATGYDAHAVCAAVFTANDTIAGTESAAACGAVMVAGTCTAAVTADDAACAAVTALYNTAACSAVNTKAVAASEAVPSVACTYSAASSGSADAAIQAMQGQLGLDCKVFNTAKTCTAGKRSVNCEWLGDMFGCNARETPKEAVKPVSDCPTRMTMAACNRGDCMYDPSTGQCHEESKICEKVECGEERGEPLQCIAPLAKKRAEGACCFTCQ